MKPTLLVLAAGIGSRYGGLKQIDPVGPHGEIIIDYSIYDAIKAGFKKIVFVIRDELQQSFHEKFDPLRDKIEVDYVFQEFTLAPGYPQSIPREKPWGTGHAVLCARNAIDQPFAVINADDFYGSEAYQALIKWFKSHNGNNSREFAMVGYRLQNTLSEFGSVSRGIGQVDDTGHLTAITERHGIREKGDKIIFMDYDQEKEIQSQHVSMNFWGFEPSIFTEIETQFKEFIDKNAGNPKAEFYIPFVVDRMIQEGKAIVQVLETSASWFGVTYQEDKELVKKEINKLIDTGKYPTPLW